MWHYQLFPCLLFLDPEIDKSIHFSEIQVNSLGPSKLKIKLSHYTPRRLLGGEEIQLLLILDLSTRWGWVVSVTSRSRFSPGERTPGTHCTGGWVGPRAGLDTEVRGKILSLLPGIEPQSPGRPARSVLTELPGSAKSPAKCK
jgi:hypothetical protein